jgi:hypothetical protein
MFIKEWIELTLYELVDEILDTRSEEEIKRILDKYAEEIYLAQNCAIEK